MAEERKKVLVRLGKPLADRLEAEHWRTGRLPRNRIIELALEAYLPPLPKGWKRPKKT